MLDVLRLGRLLMALAAWVDRQQREAAAYLLEEHRMLRRQIPGRVRLTDRERRRLAVLGHRLGRSHRRPPFDKTHGGDCRPGHGIGPDPRPHRHRRLINRGRLPARG